jgi:hypothetical protein
MQPGQLVNPCDGGAVAAIEGARPAITARIEDVLPTARTAGGAKDFRSVVDGFGEGIGTAQSQCSEVACYLRLQPVVDRITRVGASDDGPVIRVQAGDSIAVRRVQLPVNVQVLTSGSHIRHLEHHARREFTLNIDVPLLRLGIDQIARNRVAEASRIQHRRDRAYLAEYVAGAASYTWES